MTIEGYLDNLNQRYTLGNATEHTFRGDLQQLLETLLPEVRATNEPKRQKCGAPDYILTKKDIHIAFIENNVVKIYDHDEAVNMLPDNIKNSDSWNIHDSYSWGKTPKIYDSIIRKI